LRGSPDPARVDRPGEFGAQRLAQERGHGVELGRALERMAEIRVDARGREPHAGVRRRRRVLEKLGRDAQDPLERRHDGVVLGPDLPPVVRRELHPGGIGLLDQQLLPGHHLQELSQLIIRRAGNGAHVVRVEGVEPPHEIAHAQGTTPVGDERAGVLARGDQILDRLPRQRRGAVGDPQLPRGREVVHVDRVEARRDRRLEPRAKRIPHLGEGRPPDEMEPEG